ncbi:MAG: twin-arginine translocation signal domain-containing protein [Acidimicrobiales bacterium]|jgi:hypothetical protein
MPGISRRRFLRDASLGAAAVGAFAVVGPQAFGAATASASPVGPGPGTDSQSLSASAATGTDVMAHVVDDKSGTISLYSGTKKITFQNHALAEALLRPAR